MKFLLTFVFVLVMTASFSQDSAVYVRRYHSVWRSAQVGYRMSYLKTNDFQSHFENTYQSPFGAQLNAVVLEISGPDNYLEENFLALGYYLPDQFNSADTTQRQLQGFFVDMSLFKALNLLYVLKEFDLPVSAKCQVGSLYQQHNGSKSHNFFLNFGLRLNPRIILFKRLTLGVVGDISWDVTKPQWKYQREVVSGSFDFKNTSYSLQANIGWRYTRWQGDWKRIYNDL